MKDRILNVILALCLLVASPLVGWKLGEYGLVELPPSVVRAMDVVCPVGVLGCSGGGGATPAGGGGATSGQGIWYGASATGNDSYSVTPTNPPVAYAAGQTYIVTVDVGNTGATTLEINGLGAKTIYVGMNAGFAAIGAAQSTIICPGQTVTFVYDGANMVMTSPPCRDASTNGSGWYSNGIWVDAGNTLNLGSYGTATASLQTNGIFRALSSGALTSSTMAVATPSEIRSFASAYSWTNAQVVALGASTTGDINVVTLPAKTVVRNAYVVITGAAAGPATVTVSCGDAIAGTPFTNYILPADAKAAANTVYGDAVGERGTAIDTEFYYLPSYTATTLVTCHFISVGANLSTVTGSTGKVILETVLVP